MSKLPEELKDLPRQVQLYIINKAKKIVKDSDVLKKIIKDWDGDDDSLELAPFCFSDDLDVSARTDHGIIYINYNLIKDCENMDEICDNIDHYILHEFTHNMQQCFGDKPTQGADDGSYLENEFEQEGFQNQTEYISDTKGEEEAEQYIEDLLDHHDVDDEEEREELKEELLVT
jgi:hypothetical protein